MGFMDAYLNQTKSLQVYIATCRNIRLTQAIMSISNGLPKESGCKFSSEVVSYHKIAIFHPKILQKIP